MTLRAFLCKLLCGCEEAPAHLQQPEGPVNPLYVTAWRAKPEGGAELAKPIITRQEDGLLVTASFGVSLPSEARVYGYCYLASRSETPFPVPMEFKQLLWDYNAIEQSTDDDATVLTDEDGLYNALLHYFGVSQRTFHVSWSLDPEGPFLVEKDLLLPPGQYTVYGRVLIPGWAVYNHIYKEFHSPLYDQDYYTLSCALSVAGTRDTQDLRAEAVQTVTIKELKDA